MVSPVRCVGRIFLLVAVLLAVLGCSPPPKAPSPTELQAVVATSESLLLTELAREYSVRETPIHLKVSKGSTSQALDAVASGRADLALIDRELDPAEKISPADGRPILRAWTIGLDGVAIVVHPSNPAQTLTRAQLREIFSGRERRWARVGGPELTIQVVSREVGTPLRAAFEQAVLQGDPVARTAVVMPGDRAVAEYVASHPEAIGYLSMAFLGDGIKALGVDGVLPGPETLARRAYPFSLPLVLVTRSAIATRTRLFVDFVLDPQGQEVVGNLVGPRP